MSLSGRDTAELLLAVMSLLVAAHTLGFLAQLARLPRVVGEITAGLLLGPTCLGALAPALSAALVGGAPAQHVLGAVYQLGLFLLLFCSGAEMRAHMERRERRTALTISAVGTLLPCASFTSSTYTRAICTRLSPSISVVWSSMGTTRGNW